MPVSPGDDRLGRPGATLPAMACRGIRWWYARMATLRDPTPAQPARRATRGAERGAGPPRRAGGATGHPDRPTGRREDEPGTGARRRPTGPVRGWRLVRRPVDGD